LTDRIGLGVLTRSVHRDLVLADRGFYSHQFWQETAATGAELLWRVQSGLTLHPVTDLVDGSYLNVLLTTIERQRIRRHLAGGLDTVPQGPTVRVIEYDIANRDTDDRSPIRLITTILDPNASTPPNSPRRITNAGNSNPASPKSKPGNAAATEYCVHTAPRWCAMRAGPCCSRTTRSAH